MKWFVEDKQNDVDVQQKLPYSMKLSIAGDSPDESSDPSYATLRLSKDGVIKQETMHIERLSFYDPPSEYNEALCERKSA